MAVEHISPLTHNTTFAKSSTVLLARGDCPSLDDDDDDDEEVGPPTEKMLPS